MTDAPPVSYSGPARVLSGVKPSGALHLGNYLGALVKFVKLQDEFETLIFVADMHAITEWQDPKELSAQTREIAAAYLASGLDPKKATIFAQSTVPAHAELAWIFNCVARLGWMDRMTQFKEKSGKHKERASLGLYAYPVLQAADILAYKATHVPVGEDQKQHLELTRDIAAKFNHDFDAPGFFPLPDPLIEGPGARIMSLRDGAEKMSKSNASDASRINMMDDAETMAGKIRKARTDADALPSEAAGLEGRAEAKNLVGIFAALAGTSVDAVLKTYGGQGFGQSFKPDLADLMVAKFGPVGGEMRRLMGDPSEIDRILREGGEHARSIADPVVAETKKRVGFLAL